MNSLPLVSVLMPVYNCESFIREAIQSVLNQTFTDFELLIIDDCSTDTTLDIIKSFSDPRIVLIEKARNSGYTDSLNHGILLAKGTYIARMDGDDICMPERFAKQVEFLNANPEIILCGTAIEIIGTNKILHHPLTHNEILVKLCFLNSFYHPTIMARRKILLKNNYNKIFEPAEDYELWTRLAFLGKLANLDAVLLQYRIHENQISNSKNSIQNKNAFSCRITMLNQLNVLTFFTNDQILNAIEEQDNYCNSDFTKALEIFNYLKNENKKQKIYTFNLFSEKIDKIKMDFIKRYLRTGNKFKNTLFLLLKIPFSDFLLATNFNKKVKTKTNKIFNKS